MPGTISERAAARAGYDKYPVIGVSASAGDCAQGWDEVLGVLSGRAQRQERCVVAVECYPGVDVAALRTPIEQRLDPCLSLDPRVALRPPGELERLLRPYLGDDPVFGFMCPWTLEDFFAPGPVSWLADRVAEVRHGTVLIAGTGAALVAPRPDVLVYADLTRWEIQQRQRRHLAGNIGADNASASARELYKRAYFVDWRAADRHRAGLLEGVDYHLDANATGTPRMIAGAQHRRALDQTVRRPFRLVPFFDPGPWGGEWMRQRFELPADAPNFAWCFDCVPEENSLLFGFGERRFHAPALPLVHHRAEDLLGREVCERFGAEFPIRFDLLDTMDGGNLSLQVHPLRSYIRERFGMHYTQDESYYLLDAKPGTVVYLGLRESIEPARFERDLRRAHEDGSSFPVDEHVKAWPSRRHAHFSIPAGTIHCSGRDNVVLEISATPYIFTFKLWDWGRLGLDGRPRPVHLEHGLANIQWDRTESWTARRLVDRVRTVAREPGVHEEATGLDPSQFIETRRHWFEAPVEHDTGGTVNVLNLVEGSRAVVESPLDAFEPFEVHHGETFVVPAAVGRYRVRPAAPGGAPLATIKASVRPSVSASRTAS